MPQRSHATIFTRHRRERRGAVRTPGGLLGLLALVVVAAIAPVAGADDDPDVEALLETIAEGAFPDGWAVNAVRMRERGPEIVARRGRHAIPVGLQHRPPRAIDVDWGDGVPGVTVVRERLGFGERSRLVRVDVDGTPSGFIALAEIASWRVIAGHVGQPPDETIAIDVLECMYDALVETLGLEAAAPAEPAAPLLQVRVLVEDEDHWLTPADEAVFVIEVTLDPGHDAPIDAGRGRLRLREDALFVEPDDPEHPRYRVSPASVTQASAPLVELRERGGTPAEHAFDVPALRPGATVRIPVRFRTSHVTGRSLHVAVVDGGRARSRSRLIAARRPAEPLRHPLADLVHLTVRDGDTVLHEDTHSPTRKGDTVPVAIEFPDFRSVIDLPGTGAASRYHDHGDVENMQVGASMIRQAAFLAACYGAADDMLGDFPEGGPHEVAENIARFVHDAFMPKMYPMPIDTPPDFALAICNGTVHADGETPDPSGNPGYACIEHADTFGAFLRALGIPAREINCYRWPIGNRLGRLIYQDACNEAWYAGPGDDEPRWQFFSLFTDTGAPVRSIGDRYGRTGAAFDLWVGCGPYGRDTEKDERGQKHRYVMSRPWDRPDIWKPYAFGVGRLDGTVHVETVDDDFPWASYPFQHTGVTISTLGASLGDSILRVLIRSPVAPMYRTADGRRVGVDPDRLDVEAVRRRFLLGGDGPLPGIVSEVPGALVLPGGVLDSIALDPDADGPHALLVVPLPADIDTAAGRLTLLGTDTGSYRVDVEHVNPEGVVRHEPILGEAAPRASRSVELATLPAVGTRAPGPPVGPEAVAGGPAEDDAGGWPRWMVDDGRVALELPEGWTEIERAPSERAREIMGSVVPIFAAAGTIPGHEALGTVEVRVHVQNVGRGVGEVIAGIEKSRIERDWGASGDPFFGLQLEEWPPFHALGVAFRDPVTSDPAWARAVYVPGPVLDRLLVVQLETTIEPDEDAADRPEWIARLNAFDQLALETALSLSPGPRAPGDERP